jgi:hypothetical protein
MRFSGVFVLAAAVSFGVAPQGPGGIASGA